MQKVNNIHHNIIGVEMGIKMEAVRILVIIIMVEVRELVGIMYKISRIIQLSYLKN